MRPVLKPALRLVWRDTSTLQIGVDPRHRVVLENLTPLAESVLALLDGTRDCPAVVRAATRLGVDAQDTQTLIDLLSQAGAIDDAATPAPRLSPAERARLEPELAELSLLCPPGGAPSAITARGRSTVLVAGCGRLGSTIAVVLAAAGVGRLLLRDEHPAASCDLLPGAAAAVTGGPRAAAAAAAVGAVGGAEVDAAVRAPTADDCADATLVVVAADRHAAVPPPYRELLQREQVPWLVAGVRETCGIVGPFVLPGRSACPRCLDMARAERDPGWAAVAAQLTTGAPRSADACGVALSGAVAAVAAGQVLTYLDGRAPSACVDATLELRLPEWSLRRRTWLPHAACGCVPARLPDPRAMSGEESRVAS